MLLYTPVRDTNMMVPIMGSPVIEGPIKGDLFNANYWSNDASKWSVSGAGITVTDTGPFGAFRKIEVKTIDQLYYRLNVVTQFGEVVNIDSIFFILLVIPGTSGKIRLTVRKDPEGDFVNVDRIIEAGRFSETNLGITIDAQSTALSDNIYRYEVYATRIGGFGDTTSFGVGPSSITDESIFILGANTRLNVVDWDGVWIKREGS